MDKLINEILRQIDETQKQQAPQVQNVSQFLSQPSVPNYYIPSSYNYPSYPQQPPSPKRRF